jgi:hypothetical protein
MPVAVAVVFFVVACAFLYGMFRAALADSGLFAGAALLLAGVNAAAGVMNCVGASGGFRFAAGTLLAIYAFLALMAACAQWQDVHMEGYRKFAYGLVAAAVLGSAAYVQFAVVA